MIFNRRRMGRALLAAALCSCVVWSFCVERVAIRAQTGKTAALPKWILIIRHAEKPDKETGDFHLSEKGKERARELPKLFVTSSKRPDPFPAPEFIFATHDSEASHRPVETVTPLAHHLKLAINEEYHNTLTATVKKKKIAKGINNLRDDVLGNARYAGKTILISWHHGTIPELAHALKATQAPAKWKGEVFDRVWQISYDDQGNATFLDRPQQLLPGDSDK